MKKSIDVCILAAGKGTRMKSKKPKILHEIAGQPMLGHLLHTVDQLKLSETIVVIGSGSDLVEEAYRDSPISFVIQREQLGTGHAVMQALPSLKSERTLILVGDAPLVSEASLTRLMSVDADLVVLSADHPNPFNYGRIIRDGDTLDAIVEHRDASDVQKQITEINTGVMIANTQQLKGWLAEISTDNDQKEYLLTDIVQIAKKQGATLRAVEADSYEEALGVNNFEQLADLEKSYQLRMAGKLQAQGVHIINPNNFCVRGNLSAGKDVVIDLNCIFEGDVHLADDVKVGANVIIRNANIGAGTIIKPFTHIDGAEISENCSVGPYARLRPGTVFDAEVAVGNFVEIKKAHLGRGSKASHLSYLGDATIGSLVNIGAGTITCNYDGVNKHHTTIEDDVFVGTNSSLVAPVTIGESSTIAAGSTITTAVPPKALGVGRGKQRNIKGWKGPRDK